MTIQKKEAAVNEARGAAVGARSRYHQAELDYTDALVDLLQEKADSLIVQVQSALLQTRDIAERASLDRNFDRREAIKLLEEIDQKIGACRTV